MPFQNESLGYIYCSNKEIALTECIQDKKVNVSTIICDFMGDSVLCSIAERLVKKDPLNFKYLISHTLPKSTSNLTNLQHTDANQLYSVDRLYAHNNDLSYPIVDLIKDNYYSECLQTFLICFDRTDPIGSSVREKINYFWVLLSFYEKYFNDRPDIDSIIYCNVPHMPWDILLFYFCKSIGVKTIFLRRTGMLGYIYIDEDFRPGKSEMDFKYSKSSTLAEIENINLIKLSRIKDLSNNTKYLVDGSWNIQLPILKRIVKNIAKLFNFEGLLTTSRVIIEGRPTLSKNATISSRQKSTFAAHNNLSWFTFLNTHFKLQNKIKRFENIYKRNCLIEIPSKQYIYVALHSQPERTTTPEGAHFDNQWLMIEMISKSIPAGWCILIKEHPKQFKYDLRTIHARQESFYTSISRIKNAHFMSLNVSQDELISKSKMTATVSGSVGWESLINGKPVLIFSENWHSKCTASRYVYDLNSVKKAIKSYSNMTSKDVKNYVVDFVKEVSSSIIFGPITKNHAVHFIPDDKKEFAVENASSAIIERLKA